MNLFIRISVLSLLITLSGKTFALGGLGHQLVCQLSYQHLSLPQQQKIDQLLAALPQAEKARINKYLHLPSGEKITFAKSCVWPDAIKRDDRFDAFKPWHYVNVSRETAHITAKTCQKDCVTQAILVHSQQLKDADKKWQKAQALMFLGHWLGDIHQPLHVSFASDLGGNKNKINSPDGRCTNLHWLWDECLLTRSNLTKTEFLQQLEKIWQASPIKQWQRTYVWQWADESLQIARNVDTQYCKIQGNSCVKNSNETLSDNYQAEFFPIIEQRIVQAAARLNSLLEKDLE
jgi:hypothetical protein